MSGIISIATGANGIMDINIPNGMWIVFLICLVIFAIVLDRFFDNTNGGQ